MQHYRMGAYSALTKLGFNLNELSPMTKKTLAYGGAGAATGALTGAVMDKDNRVGGALGGAAIGGVAGALGGHTADAMMAPPLNPPAINAKAQRIDQALRDVRAGLEQGQMTKSPVPEGHHDLGNLVNDPEALKRAIQNNEPIVV